MNNEIYCVKCKEHTGSLNPHVVQTQNGRYRLVGQCDQCGSMKSKFISGQHASGLLGKIFGAPGGKIPFLGDLPLVGALF